MNSSTISAIEKEMSPRKVAVIAGLVYLLCFSFGIFFHIFVRSSLIVYGDVATTVKNILANELLFRMGLVSDLLFLTFWLVLLLSLYHLLKPVNKIHALLMATFGLVLVPILFVNDVFQLAALLLLSGSNYVTAFETGQLNAQVMFFLEVHKHGYEMTQIFMGLWLLPFGCLVFKSGTVYRPGFFSKVVGILLVIGGAGYLTAFMTFMLAPDVDLPVVELTCLGEVIAPFWLLFGGGKPSDEKSPNLL